MTPASGPEADARSHHVCDLVIVGGTLIDGTGAPAAAADVGVTGGQVTAVAAPGEIAGTEALDASGHVVCPGFVDLHSHADFSIAGHPGADTALRQGVTTLVTGNCGWSPFPCTDPALLAHATAFMHPELSWDWSDAGGFADAVDETRPAVNLALQAGHSSLRLAAMGTAERAPDAAELERMCRMLRTAAEQGVHGFSSGLIYAPGCYAESAEVTELARVAAEYDLLYSTHMRDEADRLLDAVREALETAERSGVRLEISHLKAMGSVNHGKVHEALALIEEAAADGVDVTCDVYPYSASSTTLTSRLPAWAMDGGVDELLIRLADPRQRSAIADALRERMSRDVDPAGVVVADLAPGPHTDAAGKSLTDLATSFGTDPAEAALRLLAGHDGAVATVNHAMSPADVTAVLRHPLSSIASDGWTMRPTGNGRPHPRSFGTFSRVLGHYVRESGTLGLVEAVRKMTSLPAGRAGLNDRGVLRAGAVADLAVFDPDEVVDRSTFEDPWRLSEGVRHVVVSGAVAVRGGAVTGERNGAVVRQRH